jgi:F0F1-type ATP synthase assembly protein I
MNRFEVALRFVGVGFYIGGSIVLGVFVGLWLDGKFGTRPLLSIVGLFLGLLIAGFGVYRMILPIIKSNDSK